MIVKLSKLREFVTRWIDFYGVDGPPVKSATAAAYAIEDKEFGLWWYQATTNSRGLFASMLATRQYESQRGLSAAQKMIDEAFGS